MEHNKYWAERFEQLTEAELRKADDLSAEMVKEYRQIAQDLNDDIQRWYARFATENKMSLAEARRVLNARELAEFRWTVDEYIKNAKKDGLTGEYTQRLRNASARVHIDRLEAIRYQMALHIERLAAKGNARLTDVLRDIYPDAHLRTAYEVQKKTGFDSFARIPEADVERILKKPWVSDGLNFSDRIWRDKERLLSTLQGELTRGLIRGEPYAKIAQRIAGRMNVAMSAASRLVETEAAFFSSKGQLDAFRDLGVEQYEFVATLDSKTSETCREMDGKVLPLSEFRPGITAPPLHCHCRSTTCPYFDDEFTENETRAARDPKTGKTVQVDSKLTYENWKSIFVDKTQTLDEWKENVASQATNALNEDRQRDKINIEEGHEVLQAKKRDHKIMITDVAIEKVSFVKMPNIVQEECERIQGAHKRLLRIAQTQNDSNEVLAILSFANTDEIHVLGTETKVDPTTNAKACTAFFSSRYGDLMCLHNHPRTGTFSMADIDTFITHGAIGLMSVVTNQGEVYILHKNHRYNYEKVRDLLFSIRKMVNGDLDKIVEMFLSECRKAGVDYGKAK